MIAGRFTTVTRNAAFIGVIAREVETDKNLAGVIEGIATVLVERAALRADAAANTIYFANNEGPSAAQLVKMEKVKQLSLESRGTKQGNPKIA